MSTDVPARALACPLPTARGLSRLTAAAYVGVGPTLFDEMVKDGRMPRPKSINSRTVWDVRALDRAFDLLPGGSEPVDDTWDVET